MAIDMTKTMRPAEIDIANKVNAIGALLFDGTFNEDNSITVPNLENYCLFAVYLQGETIPIYVFSLPSDQLFRGGSSTITLTPKTYIYSIVAKRSGNTLTYEYAAYFRVDNAATTKKAISKIYGIV